MVTAAARCHCAPTSSSSACPRVYDTLVGKAGLIALWRSAPAATGGAGRSSQRTPILILDGPPRPLDTESERRIQNAWKGGSRHAPPWSSPSSVRKIEGRSDRRPRPEAHIDQAGHHAELLARGGNYARLHAMQFWRSRGAERCRSEARRARINRRRGRWPATGTVRSLAAQVAHSRSPVPGPAAAEAPGGDAVASGRQDR